jgi:uncharacterized protein YqeY
MSQSLREQIDEDLKVSLKSGDKTKVLVLRLIKSSVHNTEIAQQKTLEDDGIISVLIKEAKQHRESIEAFKIGKRDDLVAKEEAELSIIESYLPKQMSRDEVMILIDKTIKDTGAQSKRDMGKVMSKLMSQLKGRFDGREINNIVIEKLGD